MICNKCGSNMPDGTKFCTECGTPLPKAVDTVMVNEPVKVRKICKVCKEEALPEDAFCTRCGNPFAKEEIERPVAKAAEGVKTATAPNPSMAKTATSSIKPGPEVAGPGKYSKMALWSLILGIAGMFSACACVGPIIAIPGLILGIVDINTQKKANAMNVTGIVCAAIGILMGIAWIVAFIAG